DEYTRPAHKHADADGNTSADTYGDFDADCYANGDRHTHAITHTDAASNTHRHGDANAAIGANAARHEPRPPDRRSQRRRSRRAR
ncbi:MAG: hypothetical protein KDD84_03040, partial [Caldilineaceae bacterium]|nr:hypothetical protein [Caldilineaceae bacterium]